MAFNLRPSLSTISSVPAEAFSRLRTSMNLSVPPRSIGHRPRMSRLYAIENHQGLALPMWGRYARRSDKQKIAEHFAVHGPSLPDFGPSWKVAPQTLQPIVRLNRDTGKHEIDQALRSSSIGSISGTNHLRSA